MCKLCNSTFSRIKAVLLISVALTSHVVFALNTVPMLFEENMGQVDEQVQFLARTREYTLFLTDNEAVFHLRGINRSPSSNSEIMIGRPTSKLKHINRVGSSVIRMQFIDISPKKIHGKKIVNSRSNYFIGNDKSNWLRDIPNYATVEYEDAYPGIDLIFYNHRNQLEFDYILEPGADPGAIKLEYEGCEKITVDDEGDLLVSISGNLLRFKAPTIYQYIADSKRRVPGRYELSDGNVVGFQIDNYDDTKALIIDPVLDFSTYLGGTNKDWGKDIGVDGEGNIYVAGDTLSSDFPGFPISTQLEWKDIFLVKLNSSGDEVIYSALIGGSSEELLNAITFDQAGNVYLTGSTWSADFPIINAFQEQHSGYPGYDAFVIKINPTGNELEYSTFLGGSQTLTSFHATSANDIAVDLEGSAYVTGETNCLDFPTVNPVQGAFVGSSIWKDAFVTKLSPSGDSLVYSTFLGGSLPDNGLGIEVDTEGNAYITGETASVEFPIVNPLPGQANIHAGFDAFLTKLNTTGTAILFSTYFGGGSFDWPYAGISIDANGNAFLAGITASSDFPLLNSYQNTISGITDCYIAKINTTNSTLIYSTYLGGSEWDECSDIDLDVYGNAYVTGITRSHDFRTVGAIQDKHAGGLCSSFLDTIVPCQDGFVTKLSAAGNRIAYSSFLGGTPGTGIIQEVSVGIAVDNSGNAYLAGWTGSDEFPTQNPIQPINMGGYDAFIVKISGLNNSIADASVSPSPECTSPSGVMVTLDGSGSSDPDSGGEIILYEWFENHDNPTEIAIGTGENISVQLPLAQHLITLKVTDSTGGTDTDDTVITVTDSTPPMIIASLDNVEGLTAGGNRRRPERLVVNYSATDACGEVSSISATLNNGCSDVRVHNGQEFIYRHREKCKIRESGSLIEIQGPSLTPSATAIDAYGNIATVDFPWVSSPVVPPIPPDLRRTKRSVRSVEDQQVLQRH